MGKLTAREKVMEAATLLFGEKGYTATTIREVAEKAGVSELTIFRNFKNKENLFRESIILRTTPVALLEEIEEQLLVIYIRTLRKWRKHIFKPIYQS